VSQHKAARHRGVRSRGSRVGQGAAGGRRIAPRATRSKRPLVLSGLAAAATGVVVTGGVLGATTGSAADAGGAVAAPGLRATVAAPETAALDRELTERGEDQVSRSDRRTEADPAKVAALAGDEIPADADSVDLAGADPRTIAQALLPEFGFAADQFSCLDSLYTGESGWRVDADNPTSSAYGIPQALPGSKMASAGPDWATNPVTQIRWGLGYIRDRYGTPCGAWSFKSGHGWY
jgi:hypothetical protein